MRKKLVIYHKNIILKEELFTILPLEIALEIDFFVDEKNFSQFEYFFNDSVKKKKLYDLLRKINYKAALKTEYSKENKGIGKKIDKVTAMKFQSINNTRIYCQDYLNNQGKREIILCELHTKKQDKNSYKEKNLIIKVNKYDYE